VSFDLIISDTHIDHLGVVLLIIFVLHLNGLVFFQVSDLSKLIRCKCEFSYLHVKFTTSQKFWYSKIVPVFIEM